MSEIMNQIIKVLANDLSQVLIVYGIFACAFASNIVFSVRLNVRYFKEDFKLEKLISSLWEALCIICGTLLFVTAIDLLTIICGVDSSQLGDIVTVAAVVLTIGKATIKYINEAYNTLQSILMIDKQIISEKEAK